MTEPIEHGPRIFVDSRLPADSRYRGQCLCGWGDEDDKPRYYATERAAKIGLAIHARRRTVEP